MNIKKYHIIETVTLLGKTYQLGEHNVWGDEDMSWFDMGGNYVVDGINGESDLRDYLDI